MPPSLPSAAESGAGPAAGARRAARWLAAATGAVLLLGCSSFVHRLREREPFRRVSPDIAFTMLRDVPALGVIDLREPEEFAGPEGHLRGALNLPLSDLDRRLRELAVWRALEPLRKATFVVYCRGSDACGEEGMRRLVAAGYVNAVLIVGGIPAWKAAGYGVLAPTPTLPDDPTLGSFTPTHWRRLSDGELLEGGREAADGLFVAGRVRGDRFLPSGGVEGSGSFCVAWWRRTERRTPGWMELRSGRFFPDSSPRDPSSPYVRGCRLPDGRFLPESRNVQ